jgi:hypothetical protein
VSLFRKNLGIPGLLAAVHKKFSKIPDPRPLPKSDAIPIVDHLMSGLAVFELKCPSLLELIVTHKWSKIHLRTN